MALSTQPYKGTRDFYPEDFRMRQYIFDKWKQVCESFGYEPYDASVIEPLELYTAKTSEEIVREQTFSFQDRGGRQVTLRPEMTPTVSRMVAARRQELAYPLRLYSIPNCFRYERMQRGRTREFWQLNADLFGVEGVEAEVEILMLTDQLMRVFGATENMFEIRINSRKLLNARIAAAGPKGDPMDVLRLIDRMDKMPEETFQQELASQVASPEELYRFLTSANLDNVVDAEAEGLRALLSKAEEMGITSARFVPAAARGFDYYTDIVFEVFDTNPENIRAMFGGGRYDGLVGAFGVDPVPTIGIAPGDVTMQNFLETHSLINRDSFKFSRTMAQIVVVGDLMKEAQKLAFQLRKMGARVSVDLTERKIPQQLKAVDKLEIPFVIFVGEEEVKTERYKMKTMWSWQAEGEGESEPLSIETLAKTLIYEYEHALGAFEPNN